MGFKIYVYIGGERSCLIEVTRIKFCKLNIFVSVLMLNCLNCKSVLSKNNNFLKSFK